MAELPLSLLLSCSVAAARAAALLLRRTGCCWAVGGVVTATAVVVVFVELVDDDEPRLVRILLLITAVLDCACGVEALLSSEGVSSPPLPSTDVDDCEDTVCIDGFAAFRPVLRLVVTVGVTTVFGVTDWGEAVEIGVAGPAPTAVPLPLTDNPDAGPPLAASDSPEDVVGADEFSVGVTVTERVLRLVRYFCIISIVF